MTAEQYVGIGSVTEFKYGTNLFYNKNSIQVNHSLVVVTNVIAILSF